jgi:ABC-type transport system involved in multi-copper enzyme maturation permease subunit
MQTLHIVGKDLRRLRWLLPVWIAILVARVTLWSLDVSQGRSSALLVGQSIIVLGTLQTVMLAFMAVRLVHEEPLVGWNAFWFTRPYSRQALLAAKLLFAAAVFIAVPLAADLITMAIYDAGAPAQMASAATFASSYVSWTLLVIALAAITPSLGAFVMASAAAAGGMTLLAMVIVMVGPLIIQPSAQVSRQIAADPRPYVAAMLILDAALAAAIVFQYRQRRWRTAAALAVAGLIASVAVPLLSRFEQPVAAGAGAWSQDPAAAPVVVERSWRVQLRRRAQEAPKQQVYARVNLQGMPATYDIDFVDIDSTLTLSDGTKVRSRQSYDDRLSRPLADSEPGGYFGVTANALGGLRIFRGRNQGNFEYWPALLTLSEEQYSRLRGQSGRLDATLQFVLNRIDRRVTLPLEPGASHADGLSRIEILRAGPETDSFVVTIRRWKATSPLAARPFRAETEFVLQNESRGEALTASDRIPLPTQQAYGVSSYEGPFRFPILGSVSIGMNREGFALRVETLRYPNRTQRTGVRTFEPDWFAGASLAVLETAPAGVVTRSVTIDDFVVPSE